MPCFNESDNLERFYKEALAQVHKIQENHKITYEFIFINDGSSDDTLGVLQNLQSKDSRIRILDFSRNFGKEAAILAGLQCAKNAEVAILIDADLQDPISLIPIMYKHYLSGVDMVCVRRVDRAGEGKIRAFLSECFYRLSNLVSEIPLKSGVRDFRLMRQSVVRAILELGEYHRFSKAIFEWVGFSKVYLEYEYIARNAGSSGWSFWKLFKYAITGLVSFSTMPLRIAFVVGFLVSLFASIFGGYIFIKTIIYGASVPGYASLMCVIVFFSGVILLILGIIGEYIARIYEQSKNRPHFVLKDGKNGDK